MNSGRRVAAALACVACVAATARGGEPDTADGAAFVAVDVEVGGNLLDVRFVDMDGDGRRDLVLAVEEGAAGEQPRREIHIHVMAADGTVPASPSREINVLEDVIVFACADVRDEPGRELVFFTRGGAFSHSPSLVGYRNNIRRLASMDLLFQVASPHALSSWSYVIERPPRDQLILPGGGGITLWGARPEGDAAGGVAAGGVAGAAGGGVDGAAQPDDYVLLSRFGGSDRGTQFSVKAPGALVVSGGGVRATLDAGDDDELFLGEPPAAFSALLEADAHYRAPALQDADGDGRTDLLHFKDDLLHVYLAGEQGLPDAPTRTEPLPPFLEKGEGDLDLLLRDLDADGDIDLLARLAPDDQSVESIVFTYFVLVNDGRRLFPDQPQQVLRFQGSGTDASVADVNADGRPDLVITKWELPSLRDLVTGFRLQRGAYVYFAEAGGKEPFGRKPALRDEQTFSIESLPDALVRRFLNGDVSGDGMADLVEVDLTGHVAIRRVVHDEGIFGGGSWSVEATPWKRFDMGADLTRLQLEDVNADGVADIINPGASSLALLFSRVGPEGTR